MAAGFKQATVNASKVPSTQTNFPTYVDLSRLGVTTLAEAQSVRVYSDSAKTTELTREIVSATEMHVKVSSLTSTFVLYVDWDGIRSDYAVTDTYGRNAVWSDYELVVHLQGAFSDSTGNGHTEGTNSGRTTGATGKINQGFAMSGSSSRSMIGGTFPSGANARTLSCWVKSDVTTGNRFAVSYGSDAARQMMGFFSSNTPRWYVTFNSQDADTGVSISTSVFQKLALTYNGTGSKGYVDGVEKTSMTFTANTGSGNFTIGNYPNQTGTPLDGNIDEIRVRKSAVTGDWETTEYNNQSDEAGFWGTWSDVSVGTTFVPKVIFM